MNNSGIDDFFFIFLILDFGKRDFVLVSRDSLKRNTYQSMARNLDLFLFMFV